MLALFLTLYTLLFAYFAWKNFKPALGLFILMLPTYLIRFNIGPLPTTLLELNFGIIFLIWLCKYGRAGLLNIQYSISNNKFLYFFISLFLISSVTGIFISDQWYISLGQWRAYFLEPMLFFLMIVGCDNDIVPECLVNPLIFSTLSITLFGIVQHFTGWHIGNADSVALASGRITSLFLSPNTVGLFIAPIIPLVAYNIAKAKNHWLNIYTLVLALALTTLLLTKSLGTFLGLAAGTLVWLFLTNYKKVALIALFIGLLLSPFSFLLLNKQQSSANRLTLWAYSAEFFTTSPKNFIFGAGIRQFFRKIQKPHYNVKQLERLIYPHNIFLNFWSEIGLFGMIAFAGIFIALSHIAYQIYKKKNKILGAALLSTLTIFLIHGLVDVPYFKNDLAFLLWILTATIIVCHSESPTKSGWHEESKPTIA